MCDNKRGLSTGVPEAIDIIENRLRWIIRLTFGVGNDDTGGMNERDWRRLLGTKQAKRV